MFRLMQASLLFVHTYMYPDFSFLELFGLKVLLEATSAIISHQPHPPINKQEVPSRALISWKYWNRGAVFNNLDREPKTSLFI